MPWLIRGPVPTMATGDCPWCEKKQTTLHLMAAMIDGQLGGDYVCAECLLALDRMRDANKPLRNNPPVEVTEFD